MPFELRSLIGQQYYPEQSLQVSNDDGRNNLRIKLRRQRHYILVSAQTHGHSLRQRRHFLVNVLFQVGFGQHLAGVASS